MNDSNGSQNQDPMFDKWLDENLADIEVPSGLKSKLVKIADEDQTNDLDSDDQVTLLVSKDQDLWMESGSENRDRLRFRQRFMMSLIGSSCAIGLLCLVFINGYIDPFGGPAANSNNGDLSAKIDPKHKDKNTQPKVVEKSGSDPQLKTFRVLEKEAEELEQQIRLATFYSRDSVASKKLRLEEWRVKNSVLEETDLRQQVSLTLAASQQTALDLGADQKIVVNNLRNISKNYPESDGSRLAETMINSIQLGVE